MNEKIYSEMQEEIDSLRAENTELKQRLESGAHSDELPQEQLKILKLVFRLPENTGIDAAGFSRNLQIEEQVVMYHLEKLEDRGFVSCHSSMYSPTETYTIGSDGRAYLIENNLLEQEGQA